MEVRCCCGLSLDYVRMDPVWIILSAVEHLGHCPKSTRHSRVESRAETYNTHPSPPLCFRPRYRHNFRPAAPALRLEFDSHPLAQYDTGGNCFRSWRMRALPAFLLRKICKTANEDPCNFLCVKKTPRRDT